MTVAVNTGDHGDATSTAGAATVNHEAGVITTEALTTAAGADYAFTLTNNNIDADSVVVVEDANGTNTTVPHYVHNIQPSAGQATFSVRNGHASAALNGTLKLRFAVL